MSKALYPLVFFSLLLTAVSCKKDDFVENKVPVADAGSSKTITLPDSVVLTGTGTDADGKVVAYLWSQVTGPAVSTIVNPGSATTAIKFNTQGNYLFQLMVTDDKGATGVDTVSVVVNAPAIKTLTLQPANNPNEYNLAVENGINLTGLTQADMPVETWTRNGLLFIVRSVLKFDLSAIPSSATIVSANLFLYSQPSPLSNGNGTDANFGTNNSMFVQQVTSSWSPSTIGWYNQPTTSTANQISVPTTTLPTLDLNLDVTSMVGSMVNTNANYGFLLRLQNESTYNSRIFVASHNPTYTTKLPKLVVVYK